jgi:hypothetical protein
MTHVQRLQHEIRSLTPAEYTALRAWLEAYDAKQWDLQFADDVATGKLDALADEAVEEVRRGGGTEL